ncbi:MAG TPA: type I methionyl aminopeptidase [Acidobacteriota bacterium]|nr:type I methionyl aminopeptidase [Acidobacteriota bacterium]
MVIFKSQNEIDRIRKASQIVAWTLNVLEAHVQPGITTRELDQIAESEIRKAGAKPAFKGYRGFPATLCVSINEEVVHGIPSGDRKLKEGDIVGLDLGCIWEDFYGDAARTYPVGKVTEESHRLLKITEESLMIGIDQARPGNRIGDIGYAVQAHAEGNGYTVVRDFVGHGIGRNLHEDPQIPNYGNRGQGPRIKAGMVLAIEPMVCQGKADVEVLSDNWTAVTKDGSLAAHFEHSVAITENGPEILSRVDS